MNLTDRGSEELKIMDEYINIFLGEVKMKSRKGFTLIELMVVILIVGILAAVAIPILRGRIDSAKWSEGRAMIGSIGTAIRAYHAEQGPAGAVPNTLYVSATGLGFASGDLDGTYFDDSDFTFTVGGMNPLTFTIVGTKASLNPTSYLINAAGQWSP
jgi:type IV pilus assembly protein PilA